MRVEKRVAVIIKWLERLKKSYSSGAIESALMDAECARADLEDLRQDVWAKVTPSVQRNSAMISRMMGYARTFSLSVIIVMASVVPLSHEVKVPAADPIKSVNVSTGPIVVFREYEAPITASEPKPDLKTSDAAMKKQPSQKRTPSKRPQPTTKPEMRPKPAATVPYDKVYSLIQTGQRALKNNSSVIKIQ